MSEGLRDELLNDPLGRNYSSMSDQQVADDLHLPNRTRNRTSMSGDEIFQQTDPAEYNALPDGGVNNSTDDKSHWLSFCGKDIIDPFATANVQFVTLIFGSGSITVSNLNVSRVETITRVQELKLNNIGPGVIEVARRP